jgi:hypothetical protein
MISKHYRPTLTTPQTHSQSSTRATKGAMMHRLTHNQSTDVLVAFNACLDVCTKPLTEHHGIPVEPDPNVTDGWLVRFPIIGPGNKDPDVIFSIDRKDIRDELGEANLADYLTDEVTHANLISRNLLPPNSAPTKSWKMIGPINSSAMNEMQSEQAMQTEACMSQCGRHYGSTACYCPIAHSPS